MDENKYNWLNVYNIIYYGFEHENLKTICFDNNLEPISNILKNYPNYQNTCNRIIEYLKEQVYTKIENRNIFFIDYFFNKLKEGNPGRYYQYPPEIDKFRFDTKKVENKIIQFKEKTRIIGTGLIIDKDFEKTYILSCAKIFENLNIYELYIKGKKFSDIKLVDENLVINNQLKIITVINGLNDIYTEEFDKENNYNNTEININRDYFIVGYNNYNPTFIETYPCRLNEIDEYEVEIDAYGEIDEKSIGRTIFDKSYKAIAIIIEINYQNKRKAKAIKLKTLNKDCNISFFIETRKFHKRKLLNDSIKDPESIYRNYLIEKDDNLIDKVNDLKSVINYIPLMNENIYKVIKIIEKDIIDSKSLFQNVTLIKTLRIFKSVIIFKYKDKKLNEPNNIDKKLGDIKLTLRKLIINLDNKSLVISKKIKSENLNCYKNTGNLGINKIIYLFHYFPIYEEEYPFSVIYNEIQKMDCNDCNLCLNIKEDYDLIEKYSKSEKNIYDLIIKDLDAFSQYLTISNAYILLSKKKFENNQSIYDYLSNINNIFVIKNSN